MKNLKELEQKYQELGQEIERLKKSEVKYPIYCVYKDNNLIVKFNSLKCGTVVMQDGDWDVGEEGVDWIRHTNTDTWERLEVCPKTGFFDRQLVWAWDNDDTHQRSLRFYCVKYKHAYMYNGTSNYYYTHYDNYEPYEGNWPEWAQEAFKTLEK